MLSIPHFTGSCTWVMHHGLTPTHIMLWCVAFPLRPFTLQQPNTSCLEQNGESYPNPVQVGCESGHWNELMHLISPPSQILNAFNPSSSAPSPPPHLCPSSNPACRTLQVHFSSATCFLLCKKATISWTGRKPHMPWKGVSAMAISGL